VIEVRMTRPTPLTRRELLRCCGGGFGALAFAGLLAEAESASAATADPLAPRAPHFPARARHVIQLFMEGGPSHVDTFDPKPALAKYAGKEVPVPGAGKKGVALPSPFRFARCGRSGLEISEVFPHLGRCADDLCLVRSLYTDEPNHEPAMLLMNCGDQRQSRPSVGSWVTYGLGTLNRNLPGFVALAPGAPPLQGAQNWQAAFLPGAFQGTFIDSKQRRPEQLIEHLRSGHASEAEQRLQLDLLAEVNRRHQGRRRDDDRLGARLESFELAYRMQMEGSDVFDLRREPRRVLETYGDGVHGRQMLLARRLVERGVRYVQVYSGPEHNWDTHENIAEVRRLAEAVDRPIAALLTDLKQRGLLDETLVVWGGEFGRTPTVDGDGKGKAPGRDHNGDGFSVWLAGGGVKGGLAYGATDEFGFAGVQDRVHVHDLHATILHLLGFDHERLTYRYAGRDFRLTDVRGEVVKGLLA
jgi:hypothetical protein